MKIGQIILKGVNNFEDFSYSFEDEWTKTIPDSLLLMGPNGSGKTTLLKSIANLWYILGSYLNKGDIYIDPAPDFVGCQLAAVQVKDFLSKPLWIYVGNRVEVDNFLNNQKNSYAIGGIWQTTNQNFEFQPYLFLSDSDTKTSELPPWVQDLYKRALENSLGARLDLPNMIFIESESRILPKIEESFSVTPEKNNFNWLARYQATTRRQGNIFNYLFTLKVIDEISYNQIILEANNFLKDKEITGFDPVSKELMIKIKSGKNHPAYLLSSGEKQILLMIAFITRELRPGGVVLIDEPDLHLHISLSNAFVSHLRQMVTKQKGQLMIASHASELWGRFTEAEKVKLGLLAEIA